MVIVKRLFMVMALLSIALTQASASLAKEPVKIVFLTWKANQPAVWKQLIADFHKKNPDISILLQVGPHSSTEYHAIVTQRLKNRDPSVDVFFMDVVWPPEFANAGWVLDLSSRFSKNGREKFLRGPVDANTFRDKIYGVPCYLAAGLFYYRKDLLEKYGFSPPSDWHGLLRQGERIREGEEDPSLYIYSGQFKQYEGLVCNMLEFVWAHGGGILDPATGRSRLDRPDVIEPTAFVRDHIIGEAAPRGALNYEEPESLDLFIQGKAIFHRNWPYAWAVANDAEKSKIAGKIGVGTLPVFGDNSGASVLGGWQFGINRFSRHKDEAWRFIRFMTSRESQEILALDAGLAPTRKAVYTSARVLNKMPHLKAFLPVFEKARPRPLSPVYPMMSQELQRFFSGAVSERSSHIDRLAKESSERMNRIIRLGEQAP